jgi:hypothetical protein
VEKSVVGQVSAAVVVEVLASDEPITNKVEIKEKLTKVLSLFISPNYTKQAALTGFEPIGKIPCRQTCPNEHLT